MKLISNLFEGRLDIVGDVHGEIGALEALLVLLGYDANGRHSDNRRLVFVGDLIDRGPDSPAVVERVMSLVASGRAQCILGNHELNLLRGTKKEGNHWFTDPADPDKYPATAATAAQKAQFSAFLDSLPLALERQDLRVVHACWNAEAVALLRQDQESAGSVAELHDRYQKQIDGDLSASGLMRRYEAEKTQHGSDIVNPHWKTPVYLPAHAEIASARQMGNPIRVLTSGEERPAEIPFWAGGRWRMVARQKWWERYEDKPVVIVGHYWRRFRRSLAHLTNQNEPDLFAEIAPHEWMGKKDNVYCVDFSVGARHRETRQNDPPYEGKLSALRIPEWEIRHDDDEVIWKLDENDGYS